MQTWHIILIIVGVLLIYFIAIYNSLVSLKNRVDNGWAQIDTQLQRRFDLIPNLVETVKGYAKHEKEVFENVAAARAGMANANTVEEKANADNMLTGTLKTLFAVAEAYPQLKADQNFMQLQHELTSTENKIAFARQFYNDTVKRFNVAIQQFPKNIVANIFKFTAREFYVTETPEARVAPTVSF